MAFAKHLVKRNRRRRRPGSSFYSDPADGSQHLRFTFCKTEKTLHAAEERLAKLKKSA